MISWQMDSTPQAGVLSTSVHIFFLKKFSLGQGRQFYKTYSFLTRPKQKRAEPQQNWAKEAHPLSKTELISFGY